MPSRLPLFAPLLRWHVGTISYIRVASGWPVHNDIVGQAVFPPRRRPDLPATTMHTRDTLVVILQSHDVINKRK